MANGKKRTSSKRTAAAVAADDCPLSRWRVRKGLSRWQIALETGISDQELQRIERDEIDPRWSTCMILLEYADLHGGGLSLAAFGGERARERLAYLRQCVRAASRVSAAAAG